MLDRDFLAGILYEIHSYTFLPFYKIDDGISFEKYDDFVTWDKLEDKSNEDKFDKNFFQKMAEYVISMIEKNKERDKQEPFARILWEIHSKRLIPFYLSKEEFELYSNDIEDSFREGTWEKLPASTIDRNLVDKIFFRAMSLFILEKMRNHTNNTGVSMQDEQL